MGWHRYTSAVDMWAVGCIVAELIGRMPLFPGADSMKQLDLLCRFSGKPSDEFIRQSRKASCRYNQQINCTSLLTLFLVHAH